MKIKTFIASILFAASSLSFAQDYPFFRDSHNLIDTSVAEKLGIYTEYKLMLMANKDFEGMFKSGLVNRELCDLFQINDGVDFHDYLAGYWDVTYVFSQPDGDRAKRELKADEEANQAWVNILASMKLYNEMMSSDKYDKDSGIISIKESLAKLTKERTVRDNSPSVRLLLPERVHFVKKYLESHQ